MDAVDRPFVVLRHEMPPESGRASHFDLMLDRGTQLRTWALPRWPLPPGDADEARQLAPHRRDYLQYEGPVRGNRGYVRRVAAGRYRIVAEDARRIVLRLDDGGGESTALTFSRDAARDYRWWLTRLTAEAVRKI